MIYKEHATCTNQLCRRPVGLCSNRIARIGENVPGAARLADDDVGMHRASFRLDEQVIEADPFFRHGVAREKRKIVRSENAGVSAFSAETSGGNECCCSKPT